MSVIDLLNYYVVKKIFLNFFIFCPLEFFLKISPLNGFWIKITFYIFYFFIFHLGEPQATWLGLKPKIDPPYCLPLLSPVPSGENPSSQVTNCLLLLGGSPCQATFLLPLGGPPCRATKPDTTVPNCQYMGTSATPEMEWLACVCLLKQWHWSTQEQPINS